jgi:membrane protein
MILRAVDDPDPPETGAARQRIPRPDEADPCHLRDVNGATIIAVGRADGRAPPWWSFVGPAWFCWARLMAIKRKAFVTSGPRNVGTLILCAGRNWISDNASTTGASLAFFCAFSLAPLLVIVMTLTGWIVGETAASSQIGGQLDALFGPSTAKVLMEAIKNSQQAQGLLATVVSVVTLLIGATTVLSALETLLEQIWEVEAVAYSGIKGWIRARLLSLGFILALGFLLLVSLTISTGLSTLQKQLVQDNVAVVSVLGAADLTVSILLVSFLFALIFRYLPARRLPWKVVAVGGLLTAALFDVGRWGVGLYLSHSTQPSAFGAAASFAALLLWLYYTSLIFLFGAEFTACLGGLRQKQAATTGKSQTSRKKPPSRRAPNSGA